MSVKSVFYQGKRMNTQRAVREVLKSLKRASVRQIRDILGLTDLSGRDRIYRAIRDLRRAGCARRIKKGIYEYREPKNKTPQKLGKIWRAIRNCEEFTTNDIVLLSGANRDYIKDYIQYLKIGGYVRFSGKKIGMQYIYHITDKATPGVPIYIKGKIPISVKKDKWLQLEEKVWELVRLILKAELNARPQIKKVVKQLNEMIG
jgi:hypothetical protein